MSLQEQLETKVGMTEEAPETLETYIRPSQASTYNMNDGRRMAKGHVPWAKNWPRPLAHTNEHDLQGAPNVNISTS